LQLIPRFAEALSNAAILKTLLPLPPMVMVVIAAAMLNTWGQVPQYRGRGRPPSRQQPAACWQYLQVVKHRQGRRVTHTSIQVVYGIPEQVKETLGTHTAYVERTHLTSRQMNGRLVRKTKSYSKQLDLLEAACAWEDLIYNLTRPLDFLQKSKNRECHSERNAV
jgi:hypothetical protein